MILHQKIIQYPTVYKDQTLQVKKMSLFRKKAQTHQTAKPHQKASGLPRVAQTTTLCSKGVRKTSLPYTNPSRNYHRFKATEPRPNAGESKDETDNDEEKVEKFLEMSDTDRRNFVYNIIRNKIDNQALIIDEQSNMKWIDQCTNNDEIYAALSTSDNTCTTFALLDVSTVFPNVVLYYDEEYLLKHSKSRPNNMATDLFQSFNQGHWLYGSVLLTHSSYRFKATEPPKRKAVQAKGQSPHQRPKNVDTGRVIAIAIGGPLLERKRRAALAKSIFGKFEHGAQETGAVNPNYPIPDGKAPSFVGGDTINVDIKEPTTNKDDTVLLIGHTSFIQEQSAAMVSGVDKETAMWVQGPGFNLGGDVFEEVKKAHTDFHGFSRDVCYAFNATEWGSLTKLYPPTIEQLHAYGVGAFFTSRSDGAFYRMFGLSDIDAKVRKQFEVAVAQKAIELLTLELEQTSVETGSGMSSANLVVAMGLVINIFNKVTDLSEDTFIGDVKKGTDYDQVGINTINILWKEVNASKFPLLQPILSQCVMASLGTHVPTYLTMEFDGLVCHCMLRNAMQMETIPTREEHMEFLKNTLSGEVSNLYCTNLRIGLEKILSKGNLYIMHDIGLDPMVDDFLALNIIDKLMASPAQGETKTE